MDGAGARASPAATERLPEERPGPGEGQKAKRRAAIAREEGGGARRCPLALTPPPPAVSPPLLLTLPFSLLLVFQHKNLTPLIHEDRLCDSWIYEEEKEENHAGNMLSHCHGKKTPLY